MLNDYVHKFLSIFTNISVFLWASKDTLINLPHQTIFSQQGDGSAEIWYLYNKWVVNVHFVVGYLRESLTLGLWGNKHTHVVS